MLKRVVFSTILAVSSLGLLFFNCQLPQPPAGPDQARIDIVLRTSDGKTTGIEIIDTIGNQPQLRLIYSLTQYIDSAKIVILSDSVIEQTIPCRYKIGSVDTVFVPILFTTPGTRTVKVTGYIDGYPDIVATVIVHVAARPVKNQKPVLAVPGAKTINVGELLSFVVSATDPDAGQQSYITVLNNPDSATFAADTFRWLPSIRDTGATTIVFVATDNGSPVLSDTQKVIITVNQAGTNNPPQWSTRKIQRPVVSGTPFSYNLAEVCSDPDGDSIAFTLIPGLPSGDTIIGKVYSYAPVSSDTGKQTVYIIARDQSGFVDTLTIEFTVSKSNSSVPDSTPPVIKFQSPSKDTVISADSFEVKITCVDDSSISSVKGYRDATAFTLKKSVSVPNLWTGMVKSIPAGTYSVIKIVAADSSKAKNRDSVTVRIKYDNDTDKPLLSLSDPVKDSAHISSSSYSVKVLCSDQSGIAFVACSLGTQSFPVVKNDTVWSANVTGLQNGQFNKMTFTATDSSLNANRNTLSINLFYDPTMTDNVSPIVQLLSSLPLNMVVKDSVITITDSLYDESGVDSVYWTLNGKNKRMLIASRTTSTGGIYTLTDTLRRYHLDTIDVYFQDKSTNRNRDTQRIIVNFNLPPSGRDTSVTTVLNTAKSITLTAGSPDGDALIWAKLGDPLHGSVTVTGATAAYTPATDWLGKDSFMVKVSDAFWSDTVNVTVTTTDNRIAPHNVKIAVQPVSDTVLTGQSLSMSVTMNPDVTPAPTYKWFRNGVSIGTAATLSVVSAAAVDGGTYKVVVSNAVGADSSEVKITVLPVYTLTVNRTATGGSVVVVKDTAVYPPGATVRLTATAAGGYRFVNWTGDATSSANPLTITMTKNMTVTANYKRQYTLTLTSSNPTKGAVSSSAGNSPIVVDSGVATAITATPLNGCKFKQWSSAASGVVFSSTTAASATVTLSAANATVQGVFESMTFKKQLSFEQYPSMDLRDAVQTSDGGYLLVGSAGTSALLVRLTQSGDTAWTKVDDLLDNANSVSKSESGYLVSGTRNNSVAVYCYAQNGNSLWRYGYGSSESYYYAQVTKPAKDNGYIIAAGTGHSFLMVKINSLRSDEWDTTFSGGAGSVKDCIPARDGGYIFVGTDMYGVNPIAVKTNSTGLISWSIDSRSTGYDAQSFLAVDTASDGGHIIAGKGNQSGQDRGFILKTTANGTVSSTTTLSDASRCTGIKRLSNGDLLIAGGTLSAGSGGGEDIYIARTTASGTVIHQSTFGAAADEFAKSLQLASDGGAVVVGDKNWIIKTDENGKAD